MQARLALVILAVGDLARAVRFYQDAFGWPQQIAAAVYAEFALPGGQRLGLYERAAFARNTGELSAALPPGRLTSTELYFLSDDPDEASARLIAAGARRLSALLPREWGDEAAYFADLDGNVLVMARPLGTG
jgi:catechol 2,3-dioxygenase-like lactoylglutathione lyase family enzyme